MIGAPQTAANLAAAAANAFQRFTAAGDAHNASFFGPNFANSAKSIINRILNAGSGDQSRRVFGSLLFSEGQVIGDASAALKSAADAVNALPAAQARTKIPVFLAAFGRSLTTALNADLVSVYTQPSLRIYAPLFLVELARVLARSTATPTTSAALQLISLKPGGSFNLSQFLNGSYPSQTDVSVSQTLVSLGG
jgi:hypothetical protein